MDRATNLAAYMQGSKAVEETGEPKRLYHATASDFSVFDPKKAAKNSGHPASRLGHFLAATPEAADLFSRKPDRFSQGTGEYKPGANIMPVHAAIKNPHVMTWKEFAGALAALNSMPDKKANKEVDAFRKSLIDAGHDGILIKGGWKPGQFLGSPEFSADNWVAFDPAQIKSATGNQGTFDPSNPDITKRDGGDVEGEGITAYHGSPHDFEQFDINKIGTGEGNQAYGHGLYFAQNEKVAKDYRTRLAPEEPSSGGTMADAFSLDRLQHSMMDENDLDAHLLDVDDNAIEKSFEKGKTKYHFDDGSALIDDGDRLRPVKKGKGHMYEVHINAHPDHFLDWDKSLDLHPQHIRDAIDNVISEAVLDSGNNKFVKGTFKGALRDEKVSNSSNYGHLTGAAVHNMLSQVYSPQELSNMLNQHGIKGIQYLDQNSRQSGTGTRNYVVFDHNHVSVKRKYAKGGTVKEYPLRDHTDWEEAHDYEKSGGKLHYEDPRHYLEQVKPLDMDREDKGTIRHFEKQIEHGEKLDPVAIYPDGHPNGRHRAHAAENVGVKKIPVVTWPQKTSEGSIVDKALMLTSRKA